MKSASNKSCNPASSFPLTRETLIKLKLKAIRKRCWFKALKQNERMLLNLTISVVQRVRSFLLVKVVSGLVSKLCEAMETKIRRLMRTEGKTMAERVSKVAQNWGYRSAQSWANDDSFIQYLTINNILS
ncbi:MAG: hypothetical protein NUK63_04575 [Candidatus Bathyarchaeum tardum]|nr:MAG: hypothetical protein NUK63_04575 [Candidatus Bathyarchaeum tardum]